MKLPNGFGSIHLIDKGAKKKRRKPYRARVINGRNEKGGYKFINIGYFATQMEAYEALMEYHKNPDAIKNTMTITDVYNYLVEHDFNKLSDSRKKLFNTLFVKYLEPIHNTQINDVKKAHIEQVLENATVTMQKNGLMLINKMFVWAIGNDIIHKNYAETVDLKTLDTKETAKQESRPFNDDEILTLWKMFRDDPKNKNVATALFLLYSGIRVGELKTLVRMGDYFVGGIKTDNGKNRKIPIHKDIEEVLPYVDFKRTQDALYKFMKKYMNHKIHDTRHTFVTYMRKNKANDNLLKAIVGHKDGDVTDIYDHSLDVKLLCDEINKLNYPKC